MAKEIDKIIQSKTAPKSNNVLWDDGENLKINRNGKWESTGTSIPQEKLDSIDFGYYTYASGNIVANWGPFTIKEGETIKVDTNTRTKPTHIKILNGKNLGTDTIFLLNENPDGTYYAYGMSIKFENGISTITNEDNPNAVTIQFLAYKKQTISNTTHDIPNNLFEDVQLRVDVEIVLGNYCPDFSKLVGKTARVYDYSNAQNYYGFCINVKEGWDDNYSAWYEIYLVDFPDVKVVKVQTDNNVLVQTISSEDKKITVV